MNTLDICIKHFGWQGGTIHQAKKQFTDADMSVKDKICSEIVAHMAEINDTDNMRWFMNARIGHLS